MSKAEKLLGEINLDESEKVLLSMPTREEMLVLREQASQEMNEATGFERYSAVIETQFTYVEQSVDKMHSALSASFTEVSNSFDKNAAEFQAQADDAELNDFQRKSAQISANQNKELFNVFNRAVSRLDSEFSNLEDVLAKFRNLRG